MPETASFDRLTHAWNIYSHNQEQVRFADQKINFLLVIASLVGSFAIGNMDHFPTPETAGILAWVLLAAYLLSFLTFIGFGMVAVLSRRDKYSKDRVPGLHYFGQISEKPGPEDYHKQITAHSEEELLRDLHFQIYETSRLAHSKFLRYLIAWICLLTQLIAMAGLVLVSL